MVCIEEKEGHSHRLAREQYKGVGGDKQDGAAPETGLTCVTVGPDPSFGLGTTTGAAWRPRLFLSSSSWRITQEASYVDPAHLDDKQWMPFPGSMILPF